MQATLPPTPTPDPPEETARRPPTWGPGRVAVVVLVSIAALISLAGIAAGGTGIVVDQTQRDSSGYLMTSARPYSSSTYALVSASYRGGTSNDWFIPREIVGTVRVRVRSARPVFLGIAPQSAVDAYLASVAHAQGERFDARSADFRVHPGGAPGSPPSAQAFWGARTVGPGERTLTWKPRTGNWRIVLMNADGSAGVGGDVSIGARVPHLLTISIAVLGGGILLMLLSGGAMYLAVGRRP
jgi:hypothetical protein